MFLMTLCRFRWLHFAERNFTSHTNFSVRTESKALWPPIALTKSILAEVFWLVLPSCSFDGSDYISVVLLQFQSV